MRTQLIVLTAFVILCLWALFSQNASAQQDPFGGPSNADPFGPSDTRADSSDPFAAPPRPSATRHLQPKTIRSRVQSLDRVKANRAVSDAAVSKPVRVGIVNDSETAQRIQSALSDETNYTFLDVSLRDVVRVISHTHEIPIIVDHRALEEIGLEPDVPVNVDLKSTSLGSFLRLMLRDLDLTYAIRDEVMLITTKEAAEANLSTRMYRLPDELVAIGDKVLVAIQSTIAPDSWSVAGGPSVAMSINHVLVISSTSELHGQVENFLNTLIATYRD